MKSNFIKKMMTAVLTAVIIVVCFASVFADTIYTHGTLQYTVADESVTIVGYFGKDAEVTIPSSIAGKPVNTIAAGAFNGNNAKLVNLPDTIMKIEEDAFGLDVRVTYPEKMNNQGNSAGNTNQNSNPVTPPDNSNGNTASSEDNQGISSGDANLDNEADDKKGDTENNEKTDTPIVNNTDIDSEDKLDDNEVNEPDENKDKPSYLIYCIIGVVFVVLILVIYITKKKK